MNSNRTVQLLLVGAGSRLAIAAVIIAIIWLLFFWATATPGGL